MFNIFAHAGHVHETMDSMEDMSANDHCTPVIIVASIVIVILLGVIAYLLMKWKPKK